MNLYNSHILSFLEYRTPGLYHASSSVIDPVNRIQSKFLREVGVSEIAALLDFNLAPLESRRDIAMLGVLHRAALKEGPVCFHKWFYEAAPNCRRSERGRRNTYRPLAEILPIYSLAIARRSAFGLISVYNLLPNSIVEKSCVKSFQRALSDFMKDQARRNHTLWPALFSPRCAFITHPLRHLC